jgi:hypothetical protein
MVKAGEGIRPFSIAANTVVDMVQITVIGGQNSRNGGGIQNGGALTLKESTVTGNTAYFSGGGHLQHRHIDPHQQHCLRQWLRLRRH